MATGTIHEAVVPGIVTPAFIIPSKCQDDRLIINNHLSTIKIKWNGVDPAATIEQDVFTVQSDVPTNNYLAGKASPQCQFYGGTYRTQMCSDTPSTHGGLFKYNRCKGVKELLSDFKVTGGFEWSANGKKFYFVDSCNRAIWEYDYNGKTGKICKYTIFY